jgi:hypothetical protein
MGKEKARLTEGRKRGWRRSFVKAEIGVEVVKVKVKLSLPYHEGM